MLLRKKSLNTENKVMIKPKKTQNIQHLQKNNIIRVPLTQAFKKFFKEMAPLKSQVLTLSLPSRRKSLASKSICDTGTECQHSKINVQCLKLLPVNMDRC